MKKFFLFLLIFLASCSKEVSENKINFSKEMNFEEFKKSLLKYAESNSYPNIDN